jgi:hypothetical protein
MIDVNLKAKALIFANKMYFRSVNLVLRNAPCGYHIHFSDISLAPYDEP